MSTIKGYKPHEKQRLIHDSINNESFKYYCLNIGRQFGKSMLGINQMLYWAIYRLRKVHAKQRFIHL